MSNFSNLITTAKGHELVTAILAGDIATEPRTPFTRIVTSSAVYQLSELEGLTELSEIRQETLVGDVIRQNDTTLLIHGGINNNELTVGYRFNAVGVYFNDPSDSQEYLFGVSIFVPTPEAPHADFIPPFNGSTTTGMIFDLLVNVGNADNVSLEVNPAANVTILQLKNELEAHRQDPNPHPNMDLEFARKNHADPTIQFGSGDDENFGHVKLSDALTSNSGVKDGKAATPKAVNALRKQIYDLRTKVSSLGGFAITGVVDTHADLLDVDATSLADGTLFLVRYDENHNGATTVYEVIAGQWEFLSKFAINLDDYATITMLNDAIQAALSDLEPIILTRAAASEVGLRTDAAATSVNNTFSLISIAKGIFNHLLTNLSSVRMALVNTINTNVNTLLDRLTAQRAANLDNLAHLTAARIANLDNISATGTVRTRVSVQRGSLTNAAETATISAVDLSRSFVVGGGRLAGATNPIVHLTSATTVNISGGGNWSGHINFIVVTFL